MALGGNPGNCDHQLAGTSAQKSEGVYLRVASPLLHLRKRSEKFCPNVVMQSSADGLYSFPTTRGLLKIICETISVDFDPFGWLSTNKIENELA